MTADRRLTVLIFMTKKINIEPGYRFGKLMVLEPASDGYWVCRCDCGTVKKMSFRSLVYQNVRSCGCLRGRKESLSIKPGMRFGKLVAMEMESRLGSDPVWLCKCDCGNLKRVYQTNLQNGKTRSCGCALYVQPRQAVKV